MTSKDQSDPLYRDYLDKKGSDNNEHYKVKIEAAELLMANTDNTFVTPVFNGSASVRDASGQLIENVVKSVRRKKTVDDAYIDQLYKDVKSLYHLDQGAMAAGATGKSDLGKLPAASVVLLTAIVIAWLIIGGYALYEKIKNPV